MPDIEELLSQFSTLGIELDDGTAAACLDICCRYSVDEEAFVNAWIAYSVSNLNGANPTVENLADFERKEFAAVKTPKRSTVSSNVQVFSSSNSKKAPVYSSEFSTPPRSSASSARTPASSKKLNFSPLVYTPEVFSPSEKFNSRKNRGQVVSSFGKPPLEFRANNCEFELTTYNVIDASKWKFFYDTLLTISDAVQDRFERLAADIVKTNKLNEPIPFKDCGLEPRTFQGSVLPYDKAKTSSNAVEIVGLEDSNYEIISLDLSEVEEFAIFPGQVIVFEGVLVGKTITARKCFSSAAKPVASPPSLKSHCQILVAAGPFTLSDTLSYEPLDDLIAHVLQHPPNILVLVGPLVDANHPKIAQGQIAETFSDFYSTMVKK
ncbi:unnamed protein product [Nesidiocoris tenuis]|uniref:DNA polymerase alpha subunit B n=1 Tax=Nesidiocoris tenuis TaxID=355587 RepID=A0A6H5HDS5_9HEMI|nr:unnamed protein product [Nesidiocoris tenuis]